MPRAQPISFQQFEGINNLRDEHRLKRTELRGAVNVDIDDTRAAARRGGHGAPLASTALAHSLFAYEEICLYRLDTGLYRLLPDLSSVLIGSGFTAGAKMAYAGAPGRVFMGDGFGMWWTDGEKVVEWGIRPPVVQPVAIAASDGAVPKGRYLYAVTYLRADGEESGTPESGVVELAGVGGIEFSQIPVSAQAGVTQKCVYLSKANGKRLFRAFIVLNATTTGSYRGRTTDLRVELDTQFRRGPPTGRVLEHCNGRMLVGDGKYLWYNPDPYKLELFSARAVRPHASNVVALAAMDDGVFVGTDTKIDFHAGADFVDAAVVSKAKYGACFGGTVYLEGSRVLRGMPGRAAVMITKRGLCVCGNGGTFQNVTEARYQYAVPRSVAAMARDIDGFTQVVAVLR